MGLFGGNIGPYMTPDGRIVQMPADLAASFPGLTPQDQADLPSAPPPLAPPPVQPGPQQSAMQQPAPLTSGPVTMPSQVNPPDQQGAPRGPVTVPSQESDAGPPNAPRLPNAPQPVTNKQLQQMGTAGGVNAELAAQQGVSAASQRQGEAIANQATAVGSAMDDADQHAQRILDQRRQAAEANAAAIQAKTEQYQRDAKAIADIRVDHSIDHPVLAAIGLALRGIGGAMQGKSGDDIMDPVYKAIDRKVAAQMQDIERKKGALALQREAIGMQREAYRDQLADMDTYRLAAIEQAKRQIATIQQKTTSDVVRANTGLALANLDQKGAEILNNGVAREQQRLDAAEARKQAMQIAQMSNATTRRGQDMQQREADLNRAERAQEKLDAIAAQIATAKGKAGEDQAKLVREAGLADPKTGDPILTEAGADKMAQADKAEAQARKATDPAQAAKLNEYAQTLRQSAQMNDVATARDKDDRKQVQNTLDASHTFTTLADSTIEKLKAGPGAWNREEWASLKADLSTAQARYVATLGERVSVKALEAFQGVTSIDPDDPWWSRSVDKGKAIAALEALKKDAASWASSSLKGAGVKARWRPGIDQTETTFKGSTAAEVGKDATPGVLTRPFRFESPEDLQQSAQEGALSRKGARGNLSNYGLDPDDETRLDALVKQAGAETTGHAKYRDIVSTLAGPVSSDRPGLSTSVARLIKDRDPKLYADVLSQIDPAKAKEVDGYVSGVAAMPKRTAYDLTDDERAQLEQQRRERGMKADRTSDADYFRRGQPAPGAR